MKFRYNITGIDCPNCAGKLQNMMCAIDGIDTAKINFLTEKLTFETALSEDDAVALLRKCARTFSKDVVIEK